MTVGELLVELEKAKALGYGDAPVVCIDPGDYHLPAVSAWMWDDAEETVDGEPNDVSFLIATD